MRLDTINVCFCGDRAFASQLPALFGSLASHHRHNQLHIHFAIPGDQPDFVAEARTTATRFNLACTTYDVSPFLGTISREMTGKGTPSNHLNVMTYARWFLADLLPSTIERCIYLDLDVLVRGDLSELLDAVDPDAPVAAAEEGVLLHCTDRQYEKWWKPRLRRLGLPLSRRGHYNGGVLVLALRCWREQSLGRALLKTRQRLLAEGVELVLQDQDVLNVHLNGRIATIAPVWNVLAQRANFRLAYPEEVLRDARVVHFSGEHKPWQGAGWAWFPTVGADTYLAARSYSAGNLHDATHWRKMARIFRTLSDGSPGPLPAMTALALEAIHLHTSNGDEVLSEDVLDDPAALMKVAAPLMQALLLRKMHTLWADPQVGWFRALERAWRLPRKTWPTAKWTIRWKFFSSLWHSLERHKATTGDWPANRS